MMRNLIIFCIFGSGLFAQSQQPDALKPDFSHQYYYWEQSGYYFIDTTMNSLEWYHQWNTTEQDDFGELVLMNMGGARNSLLLPQLASFNQYQSFGPYSRYFTSPEQIKYYQVRSPLTAARYINGYDRGQMFRIFHTQNITKDWNFTVKYRRLNSLSFYLNDQNKQSSFSLNSHYRSPKGSYEAYFYFASEKADLQENGGIQFDSIFTDNLEGTRSLLLTQLDLDQRILYNRDYFIDQKIDFWKLFGKKKKKIPSDTIPDSLQVETPTEAEKRRSINLGHQGRFNRQAQTYRGFTSDVYDRYYFDQDGSYLDSIRYASLYNEIYLQTIIGDTSLFNLKAGAFHQFIEYGNQYFSTGLQHLGLSADLKGNYKQYFNLKANGSYILGGPFANDFNLQATVEGRFFKSLGAFASYQIQNKHPELMRQVYIGNNYLWNLSPGAILLNDLSFGIQWGKNNFLRFRTFSANDYVYFGADLKPAVADEIVAYQSIDLLQNFSFWNWLHQDNELRYQIALSGSEFMPLPELVNRHSLYFRFPMFKGALQVMLGAEASYFSSFNSPSYSAATGQLYLANEYPIGNYYLVDAFAEFKIAKAIIFIKMQNVTEGLSPYNYWAAPHYPLNDRVFRFGVNWRFFN